MKLVNRKTRRALKKSVRKAMKKHGPAIVSGLASGLAAALAATVAESPGKNGKTKLSNLVTRVEESLGVEAAPDRETHKKKAARRTRTLRTEAPSTEEEPTTDRA